MTQPGSAPFRFEALDALRGLCALLVVLFHIPIHHALKDVGAFANLQVCVDIFFVLSGFVLSHAYGRRLAAGGGARFVLRRFARLWPLHMAMLALLVALELAKLAYGQLNASFAMDAQPFSEGHSLREIATNILFLQAFGLHPAMSWNGPAWSVAVEFYVSLVFGAVVLRFPRRHEAVFLMLAVASGLALALVSPRSLFVSTDWGVLRAALGFFLGCLIYGLRARSTERLGGATGFELSSLAMLLALGLAVRPGPGQYLFVPAACLLVFVFSYGEGCVSALIRSPALQALGRWSYSIYMVHTLIFQVMKTGAGFLAAKTGLTLVAWHNAEKLVLIGSPGQALIPALVAGVALVVPVAALTYRWIERPAMEALTRGGSWGRRRAAAPQPSAGVA